LRLIVEKTLARDITSEVVADYIKRRAGERFRGQPISGATIRKELRTLSSVWNWAESRSYVSGRKPTLGQRVPREVQAEPFRTFSEIVELTKSAKSEAQCRRLWDSVFLDQSE